MAQDEKARLNPGHNLRHEASSSTFRWRRNRSSANLLDQVTQAAPAPAPAPAKPAASKPAPNLARTPSKMSLFNLFSKPKVEKARGYSSEIGLAVPMQEQPKPKPAPVSTPKSSLRANPPPAVQQVQRSRSSQMLRPMSLKPSVRKPPENWDPPPLFQAYPQSVKYATVQACTFSPDVLLRSQSQRKQYDLLRERMDSHRDLSATLENTSETKKLEKTHRRLISNSVLNPPPPQLTNKIYVLVTAGYVLQYSGDGPFDRLPEKVLKLGQESAAFACDLIPGKHFVLQISQSASEDGTVSMGPKNSLLSRLRLQNASARRAATSFLLVLESASEMESWMTAVRKEIEALGGPRTKEEPSPIAESPVEDAEEKKSTDTVSHRYFSQREPKRMSKLAPIDSPLQSQYSDSPKIVASDWEGSRSEKTVSITDSSSLHSSRHSTMRRSVEVSSIATTPISHDGHQLDQLRERSRFSYMSATSASGTGSRITSRNSSPAPNSPSKEGFNTAETESLRSATSLRSFHMNPSSATSNRRRSMQPLPITNEDSSLSAVSTTTTPQRHSIYGPTSPTVRKSDQELTYPTSSRSSVIATTPVPSTRPANNVRYSSQFSSHTPVRSSARSSSAPPTRNVISPPPRDPAPPPQGRPQSTIGSLPGANTLARRSANRLSQTPKPFLRPFPIRPQNTDGSVVVPRRFSSLGPAPIPLGIVVNRSVTSPLKTSSARLSTPPKSNLPFELKTSSQTTPPQLRRPISVQVRSDPAPFLSSYRPMRAISSTPSFLPGKRASSASAASLSIHSSPSVGALRQQAQQQAMARGVTPRKSMPVIGLPPPAPPPSMPLPPTPPGVARMRAVAV
ncbi:hypothetical protein BDV96DRAFT_502015 [Lophiotrema nucula]|uniref:PH domain-containing protein n=1 Tax=Lophiotrema nucula TaxID=690887 RepID=A0A6A5YSF5_9PLEO|nr:hypothetical protein BDV96DRAFT_502015 [Lophiotrema nucula]